MEYRDFIIGPEEMLGIPKGKILAVPKGENGTISIELEKSQILYKKAVDFFVAWNTQTGGVDWEGINYRASTGMPVEFIRSGGKPIVYFRKPSIELQDPKGLGYPEDVFQKFLKIKTGIVLFCGAQGSGKTTGMMSFLKERVRLNKERAVTFEAPPEYMVSGNHGEGFIDQIAVPTEAYFPQCASISLRMASPDIVCYGELRDYAGVKEIANNAFSSHLIITTLHSTDIVTAIERMATFLTAGEVEHREYFMRVLSESVKLVIHQQFRSYKNKNYLSVEYLEHTEAVRSAIYSASSSARLTEVLERQILLRRSGEM